MLVEGALTSTVTNRTTGLQLYRINAHIKIVDEENDVDSLYLFNEDLNVKLALSHSSVSVYDEELSVNDLNLSSIGDIIGKEFIVIAQDEDDVEFNVGTLTVKRIIQEPIELLGPLNGETVHDTIEFKWTRFEPGYSFHYLLQVYIDVQSHTEKEKVFEKDNISSEDIAYKTTVKLNPDAYHWRLWVVDDFGNKAVSFIKKFNVE